MPYTPEQHETDKERILTALDALHRLREEYKDVVAIPEVVALHDITEYRLDTPNGPTQFKELYGRDVAVKVLEHFAGTDYITPETFEFTIACAILDQLKQKKG